MSPIVFLHGWGRTGADFQMLRGFFESAGFKALAFDLPGFGDETPLPEPWAVKDYVQYVKQKLVRDGIEKCILVGHSFGARIAVALAAFEPTLVERLVLIGAPLARSLTFKRRLLMLASMTWRLVKWLPGARALQNQLEEALRKRRSSMDFLYTPEGVMRETLKKVISENLRPYLRRITMPALVIYGSNDRVTPVKKNKRALLYMSYAKLEIIEGAGHMAVIGKPQVIAGIIQKFIVPESVHTKS